MDAIEAATAITKAAIENDVIDFALTQYNNNYEKAEEKNLHNSKQIADFYKVIFEAISSNS